MLHQVDLSPFLIIGACLGLAVLLVPLYFLISQRQAFESPAPPKLNDSPAVCGPPITTI
jgi:hypothetical protein